LNPDSIDDYTFTELNHLPKLFWIKGDSKFMEKGGGPVVDGVNCVSQNRNLLEPLVITAHTFREQP